MIRQQVYKLRNSTSLTMVKARALQAELLTFNDIGELNIIEFEQMMCRLFPGALTLTHATAVIFFDAFDTNSSKTLDIAEILRGLALCCSKTVEDFVNNMFDVFDTDKSGDTILQCHPSYGTKTLKAFG